MNDQRNRPRGPDDAPSRTLERALSSVPLASPTSRLWCETAVGDLPTLLEDHCQCELKAGSSAMALIGRNPEKELLARRLMSLIREEMQHYRQMRDVLAERGFPHRRPQKSPYLHGLFEANRGGEYALLDSLMVSALVEARSCERFVALARALAGEADSRGETGPAVERDRAGESKSANATDFAPPLDAELAWLYAHLAKSESGHAAVFVELAKEYYDEAEVRAELARRVEHEAQVMSRIPVTARMHGGNGPD